MANWYVPKQRSFDGKLELQVTTSQIVLALGKNCSVAKKNVITESDLFYLLGLGCNKVVQTLLGSMDEDFQALLLAIWMKKLPNAPLGSWNLVESHP